MKKTIYNIILVILVITFLTVILVIVTKRTNNQIKEKDLTSAVVDIKTKIEENKTTVDGTKKIETKYKGYHVVGIIKISKINIEYPIISQTNDTTMALSITKFWGNNVNDIGNFTMAGHNYFDGTMFSNTNKLKIDDIIEMMDLNGNTVKYKVFDKYITDPNDTNCVKNIEENTREITLITCINGRSNRLIIKARQNLV